MGIDQASRGSKLLARFDLAVKLSAYIFAAAFEARMAELVDASDSKSGIRKDVQVRFLFRARLNNIKP